MSLSSFERKLLESGKGDAPSEERRSRARAAALRAAGLAGAAAVTARGGAKSASAGTSVSGVTLAKILVLSVLGAGAVAGVAWSIREPEAGPAPSAHVAVPSAAVTASEPPPVEIDPAPMPTASSPAALRESPAPAARPASSATAEDAVLVEARLLESARQCLKAADTSCANARMAEHRARFGERGALFEEAGTLSVDVAVAGGDQAEARRLARALVTAKPGAAWPARVRRLAGEPVE